MSKLCYSYSSFSKLLSNLTYCGQELELIIKCHSRVAGTKRKHGHGLKTTDPTKEILATLPRNPMDIPIYTNFSKTWICHHLKSEGKKDPQNSASPLQEK